MSKKVLQYNQKNYKDNELIHDQNLAKNTNMQRLK